MRAAPSPAVLLTLALMAALQVACGLNADSSDPPQAVEGIPESQERQAPPGGSGDGSDAGTPLPPPSAPPSTPTAQVPSDLLDLTNWKITLPTGPSGDADEVAQPQLKSFNSPTFFHLNGDKNGIVFAANTGGTTTSGSTYPRSELREMTSAGTAEASWATNSGTHTLLLREAITRLPVTKPHLVAGQIHGTSDDVIAIRLEGTKLFVDLNGTDGPTLDANYQLGKIFDVKLVAHDGTIDVFYNGATTPKISYGKSLSGCYFKAGAYPQSNTTTEGNGTAVGEVTVYALSVTHAP